jgi:hypothetical protein
LCLTGPSRRRPPFPQDLHDLVASRRAVAAAGGGAGADDEGLDDEEALAGEEGDEYDEESRVEARWGGEAW